jgi:hypothetical protein
MTLADLQADAWQCAETKGWYAPRAHRPDSAYIREVLTQLGVDLDVASGQIARQPLLMQSIARMVFRLADLAETVEGDLGSAVAAYSVLCWQMPAVAPCDDVVPAP